MKHLAQKVLVAVLAGVGTTLVGKAVELAWGHVRMPGVLYELTVGIWYVWLGLAAAAAFYLIATLRERAGQAASRGARAVAPSRADQHRARARRRSDRRQPGGDRPAVDGRGEGEQSHQACGVAAAATVG